MKEHRYQQVHRELKQRILHGEFGPGAWLPSENELSEAYQITRVTVRQALGALEREGYIERQHGRGSLVRSPVRSLGLLSFRGFSEVVGGADHTVRTEAIVPPTERAWPEPFFYPLGGAELAGGCLYLQRLRRADQDPVMWEHTWLPRTHLVGGQLGHLVDGSLFKTLHLHHHLEMTNVEQLVRALPAAPDAAQWLAMPAGTPLLHIYRRYHTSVANQFIYSSLYCNTTKYAIGSSFD
jgi:GntR family transcriptional regulator/GntR family frlABCD operon transcriptional regulator